jgi:plastocyanin
MTHSTACAALVVYISAAGCGSKTAPSPSNTPPVTGPPATGTTISIVSNSGTQAFSPNPASVPAGQTVVFRNTTGSAHRILADNSSWDAGTIAGGAASAAIAIGAASSFHCSIHGSMTGSIAVVP